MFAPDGLLRNSRSQSTFMKHQSENEKLGVHFWLDKAKHIYLTPDLLRELRNVNVAIDYADLEKKHHSRYLQNGGKKTLHQRKKEYRVKLLCDVVGGFLGKPGTKPPRRAFDLAALSSNADVFLQYIAEKMKADGSIMKPDVYKGFRSSLTYLFNRYDFKVPENYNKELSRCMQGVAKITKGARQNGEVSQK